MKEFNVKRTSDIVAQNMDRNGAKFSVKPLVETNLLTKCSANIVEVSPKSFAYGYHYHEATEEIFYVLKGEGYVKTIKGEISVKAGDAISFPTGVGGSHVMYNTSESETLVYIDYGTKSEVDIAHLPDINKMMVYSKETNGIFDEPAK